MSLLCPEDYTTRKDFPHYPYNSWLDGVADTGSLVVNPASTYTASEIGLPDGWTMVTE